VRSCLYNSKLKCPLKKLQCPLQDTDFIRALELFLFTGRTPHSASMMPATKGQFDADLDFSHYLKAIKAMCFGDDPILEYAEFHENGKINMTQDKCLTWRIARSKWRRLMKRRER